MDIQTVCRVLAPIRELEREAGGELDATYQHELAKEIKATGKPAGELTINELLALCKRADEAYQALMGR